MNKNKTKRLQFEFPDKSIEKLDELVERCGESTRAAVMRNAFKLYNYVLDQVDNGFQVQLTKNGETTTIVSPVLYNI